MIKKVKSLIKKSTRSLRMGMLVAIIFSLVLGVGFLFISRSIITGWVDNDYNSDETKNERYENYIADLQMFVSKNGLSSNDTAEITNWVHSNRNVYLFLYKDNQLFFDSSIDTELGDDDEGGSLGDGKDGLGDSSDENESDASDSEDGSDGGENSVVGGEASGPSDNVAGGESDEGDDSVGDDAPNGEDGDENASGVISGNDANDSNNSNNSSNRPSGGLTVDYPTREEIIATAEKNGLRQLELSDGTLFVSLADFTDYLYYDIANIVSVIGAVLIVVIILMLYFQNIMFKISRLAKDVSTVYEVDMNTPIRTDEGTDELSALTRNVEQMRSSMIESLEKEKQAIDANTELITSMSHDIRTPLTVLLGYLDIMKGYTDDETMKDYIKASEVTALRLKELSDDMFRYFLVFGGKDIKLAVSDYDAKTLFDQLFTEHMLLLTERGYRVKLHIGNSIQDGVRVLTDAPQIMRVVDNIFSNIYKYADKEREITVAAGSSHGRLTVAVKNYIAEKPEVSESNRIGLKTCEKLCEALGMGFEYFTSGVKNQKTFTARMDFPIKRELGEGNAE